MLRLLDLLTDGSGHAIKWGEEAPFVDVVLDCVGLLRPSSPARISVVDLVRLWTRWLHQDRLLHMARQPLLVECCLMWGDGESWQANP